MALKLMRSVENILELVKTATGRDVEFVEKEILPVPAMIRTADPDAQANRLYFRKEHGEIINHVIANECGHILRFYSVPEDQRCIPVANQKHMACYAGELEADIRRLYGVYSPDKLMNLIMLWYESILYQLTKMPTDIAIEKWIHHDYPDLVPVQLVSLADQNDKAVAVLSTEIRDTMPGRIYDACNIMNYVYFRTIGLDFDINYVEAFRFTKFFARGEELIARTADIRTDNHEGDILMINAWAKYLEFSDWFEWTALGRVQRQHLQ